MHRIFYVALGLLPLFAPGQFAPWPLARADELTDSESQVDFEASVEPILTRHCAECHGADEQNGALSFADRASVFAVADSGRTAVVPGELESSELIRRVTSTDEDFRMPPDGESLSAEETKVLSDWILAGAPWAQREDAGQSAAVTSSHWSFQPIDRPTPPHVENPGWPLGPLDRFVQAARDRQGVRVTADADAATLFRRASFALTGLPPDPVELADFLGQANSEVGLRRAFAEVVERLLNRPSYGERWGRHWMDWVRYADTAGDNSDFPIPQAYLYRQYIIDSFNEDLPYDQFLIEQLAGDLLTAENLQERNHQQIATGYLAMARRFGSLVERYPWHLTIEDTIDNVGRTMMGLTLACARCHDHKFDPVSTRDYYGLYGIFASTQYPFPGIELFQAQWNMVPLIPEQQVSEIQRPFQNETNKLAAELNRLLSQCEQQAIENAAIESECTLQQQRKMRDELDAMLIKARKAGENLAKHLKTVPAYPVAYAVGEAKPTNANIHVRGEPTRPGAEVPRKFPDILGAHTLDQQLAGSTSGRLQLARWIASPENPLTARVIVNRIWQRHFGEGLVASTSDFGLRGETPSHPELLDWLASEFIRSGWSIKHLQRLIMNSRTYQLSSLDVEQNLSVDPTNRYLWKFNRQRLDAESIRDALMSMAGSLDPTPQSEPYPIPPQQKWTYTQHHPFKDDYASNKRSVYLMTRRLTAKPYFQTFDGPDPNVCTSDRDQSVTPLQALYFVNDEFLHEQASLIALDLIARPIGDRERVGEAVALVLGRQPSAEEVDLMLAHVHRVRQRVAGDEKLETTAWSSLVRSLLRLNEFLYVD